MKKVGIFYFSGTGNTWWVASRLCEHLQEKGFQAAAHSIEGITLDEANQWLREWDMVGFGYPIYGSDLPENMKDFIRSLAPVQQKTAFVFCSQWLWSGDGARIGGVFLTEQGFDVQWAEHFSMPNNVSVAAVPLLPYTNDREAIDRKLAKADKRMGLYAARMAKGRPFRRGYNFISEISGAIQRVPFRYHFSKLRNDIQVDAKKCIRCGQCIKLCPSKNLFFEGDTMKTVGTCLLCLRCYNFCPKTAVLYMKKPHNHKRGETYNGPVDHFDIHQVKS